MPIARHGPVSPRKMVDAGLCTGCGACVAAAGKDGCGVDWAKDGQLKPSGPPDWMNRSTAAFSRLCPFSPGARNETQIAHDLFPDAPHTDPFIGRYGGAYVGHAREAGYRERGSSGGMVNWMAAELLRRRLIDGVAHVTPARHGRLFRYTLSRGGDALNRGAKSRYYPVEMSQVLREIGKTPGRYAVIGIPCFIKAVQLLRESDPLFRERIVFTLGLVCGHMKSRYLAESFAWQMGTEPEKMEQIEFRVKDAARPANWYTAQVAARDGTLQRRDWWHLLGGDWGSGFFQNAACDFCDDVVAETADASFGDAWVEPHASDGRGTNVVVVRSTALLDMLRSARAAGRVKLEPVDAEFVRRTQAAGFRQRREGLAYRLGLWRRRDIRPVKRVVPGGSGLPLRRKLIYRCRRAISRWSAPVFLVSRRFRSPWLFGLWAEAVIAVYDGLAYSRGPLQRLFGLLPER